MVLTNRTSSSGEIGAMAQRQIHMLQSDSTETKDSKSNSGETTISSELAKETATRQLVPEYGLETETTKSILDMAGTDMKSLVDVETIPSFSMEHTHLALVHRLSTVDLVTIFSKQVLTSLLIPIR